MKKVFEEEFEEKIFEKQLEKEMKWVGISLIVLILSFVFLLSFSILVVVYTVLADIEILKFINK